MEQSMPYNEKKTMTVATKGRESLNNMEENNEITLKKGEMVEILQTIEGLKRKLLSHLKS